MIHIQAAGNDSIDARYGGFFCSVTEEIYHEMDAALLEKFENTGIQYKDIEERILIVGAVENTRDVNGNYVMASFTNYGSTMDICAPGHIIFTTMAYDDHSYGAEGGTSLSAPMVTGSVALLWALDPELTVEEIRHYLIDSSQILAIVTETSEGWACPMLNIGAAVKRLLLE